MLKTEALEFKDLDGYWYSCIKISCQACGGEIAETVGTCKYDTDRAVTGEVRVLQD